MGKKIVLFVATVVFALSAAAQSPFDKDDLIISAGIGLGNTVNIGSRTVIPPVFGSVEYCVVDGLIGDSGSIGVGGVLAFARSKDVKRDYTLKTNAVIFGAKGSFHYSFVKNLDTYAALTLGCNVAGTRELDVRQGVDPRYSYGGFFGDFNLGARYYVMPNLAFFGEFGFGLGFLNLGVTFKM